MTELTAQRLRELLAYDPLTGVFTRIGLWRNRSFGSVDLKGYIVASVDGRGYKAHRLAWLHAYGEWPNGQIDHINGDKADNRIANLRDTDHTGNAWNQRSKAHRLLGAHPHRRVYHAKIAAFKRSYYLGTFETELEAHRAYMAAKARRDAGMPIRESA